MKESMDGFSRAAKESNMRSALVIGASFGIFIVIGNVWADFLHACVTELLPDHENPVIRELLYASLGSFIGLSLMFVLLKLDKYCSMASQQMQKAKIDDVRLMADRIPGMKSRQARKLPISDTTKSENDAKKRKPRPTPT